MHYFLPCSFLYRICQSKTLQNNIKHLNLGSTVTYFGFEGVSMQCERCHASKYINYQVDVNDDAVLSAAL